ncbi:MAG: S8 family peptidase [Ruminococcaceae bacterium]|nr:S8 family peptidase [Oscillospiraceae bacterium]
MNHLLQVKLRFANEKNKQRPGARNLRVRDDTTSEKIDALIDDLNAVLRYYRGVPKMLDRILIDVNYNDIIAKSNRIKEVLKPAGSVQTNDVVVGARFSNAPAGEENHIITYYVDAATIERTIQELRIAQKFLEDRLNSKATYKNFNEPDCEIDYSGYELSKSQLRHIVVDCSVIDSFSVPRISETPESDTFLVTFYQTELPLEKLMEKLKVDETRYRYSSYGKDTISVTKDFYDFLESHVPYMISMISTDFSQITIDQIVGAPTRDEIDIPAPSNEPVIGVIDTLFDESVYFHDWVENTDYLSDIERSIVRNDWKNHGTEVSSIIVDGPTLNPWLDDGCGRFRVRHFGVCGDRISVPRLVRKIKEIVTHNPDIHVWNLSLGTEDEVSKNFISFDAAVLDELQFQKNVLFVISGTNDEQQNRSPRMRIGSPADSLNAVVVNSVKRSGIPASYSREGTVLSFFNKPDVSYYGGDYDERIVAYSPYGKEDVCGTSFAAPWISRKLCYMIDVMGLPREVAKALLIDSAADWDYKASTHLHRNTLGYGVVPISIEKLLSTESDEIRFVVYGTSESYRTTNYAIPVPKDEDGKYPYIARATLCYFPECTRSQGVDYTGRELSLQFGRVKANGAIEDINDNVQDEETAHVDERQSRKDFRKWENTKFISKVLKRRSRPAKSYEDRLWGMVITSKLRLGSRTENGLNFGAVVTLREINGVNRIQDFIRACTLRGWIVNELDIQQKLELYNSNQEDIKFE